MRKDATGKLDQLFKPFSLGTLTLKNRIVMTALATSFTDDYGVVTEKMRHYYEERAKGGVGLIISEMAPVDLAGRTRYRSLMIHRDDLLPGLKSLVEVVHKHRAKIAVQLCHAGRFGAVRATHMLSQSASGQAGTTLYASRAEDVRKLSAQDVKEIVKKFGEAARRAKRAGFDAIEIHGAHGLLIHEFLSPLVNHRTDEYGGDLEGRMRFPIEVLRTIRKNVGQGFPIIYRISADEGVKGGLTAEESASISQRFEQEGADAIDVSSGTAVTDPVPEYPPFPPMCFPRGIFLNFAATIKKAVNIPVIAVGRINDPVLANDILKEGKADLIGMARGLLADPELPSKAAKGLLDEIRPCIACMTCCHMLFRREPIECLVNPAAGREKEFAIRRAKVSKKVVIIGGGPAGMEAARVAALRGHRVVLFERNRQLGGQLNLAVIPPHKEEVRGLINYLVKQVGRLGVRVYLGQEATISSVEREKPDVVIVATGATTFHPKVPGVELEHVVTVWDVLTERGPDLGKKIVIAGGGRVGCETAEFLAAKGHEVVIAAQSDGVGRLMEQNEKRYLLRRLKNYGVEILTNAKLLEIRKDQVILGTFGETRSIPCDHVVLAKGASPVREVVTSIRDKFPNLFLIGDCVEARSAKEAIYEGSRIAREI